MLTRDVRFRGFSASSYRRLGELFGARAKAAPAAASFGRGVVALTRGERLLELVRTDSGPLACHEQPWPEPLPALAARHGARYAVSIEEGAIEELMDRFGERLEPELDLLGQILLLLQIGRELEAERRLRVWPRSLQSLPVPSDWMVASAFDLLCPDGRAVALGVFDGGELWTAIAMRRKGTAVAEIVGAELLRERMGLVSGEWTRDYLHLIRACEGVVGPLGLGCFGERATLERLLQSSEPGAWSLAVAQRDIILSPAAPGVVIPLGVDLGRRAIASVLDWVQQRAPELSGGDSALGDTWQRLRQSATQADLKVLLGFDPLKLLRSLISRH
ncbi:MAG TPA: hypothetical protein VKZ49_05415 [Polyangiaceae bacterium]|nr:hypothetical protein [Polyangiaceae bacterium]